MHSRYMRLHGGAHKVAAAFDIDERKVGRPLRGGHFLTAQLHQENSATTVHDNGVIVAMGHPLDGISDHMKEYPEERRFVLADAAPADVTGVLREGGVEVLVNYLPVGSEEAARFTPVAVSMPG